MYSSHGHSHPHHVPGDDYRDSRGMDRAIERMPPRDHRQLRDDEYASHRGSSRRALNAIQWRLSTEQPIEEELQDDLTTPIDVVYKPQVPREFRDDRRLTYDDERDRRRTDDDRRMDRRMEDDRRYERRYQEQRKSDKAQGRNYRKELLERFADMELEDHQEFHGSQRYYE